MGESKVSPTQRNESKPKNFNQHDGNISKLNREQHFQHFPEPIRSHLPSHHILINDSVTNVSNSNSNLTNLTNNDSSTNENRPSNHAIQQTNTYTRILDIQKQIPKRKMMPDQHEQEMQNNGNKLHRVNYH